MASPDFTKDPDDVLDYSFDWSAWLAPSETIVTSTWTPSAGITVNSNSNTAFVSTVWLSGGTAGQPYNVTNRIVTNQARTVDRTMVIRVTNK